MSYKYTIMSLLCLFFIVKFKQANAQVNDSLQINARLSDSIYILETEHQRQPVKVLHAEPLYIDLIRDLGARKGEKEWNLGIGLTDNHDFDSYTALVEYEFAPVNRLGLEVELPFTFYYKNNGKALPDSIPPNRLNSLKLAGQYSFFVSERLKTSMALGYIHEFELAPFKQYGKSTLLEGHIYNPFFVVAKRWGNNFHSLVYTGPYMIQHVHNNQLQTIWQTNTSFHYMISGTRNFIGVELNKETFQGDFDMTIRPQLRVGISENLLVGIVAGVPISRENERFSTFVRVIYEPKHKK